MVRHFLVVSTSMVVSWSSIFSEPSCHQLSQSPTIAKVECATTKSRDITWCGGRRVREIKVTNDEVKVELGGLWCVAPEN